MAGSRGGLVQTSGSTGCNVMAINQDRRVPFQRMRHHRMAGRVAKWRQTQRHQFFRRAIRRRAHRRDARVGRDRGMRRNSSSRACACGSPASRVDGTSSSLVLSGICTFLTCFSKFNLVLWANIATIWPCIFPDFDTYQVKTRGIGRMIPKQAIKSKARDQDGLRCRPRSNYRQAP